MDVPSQPPVALDPASHAKARKSSEEMGRKSALVLSAATARNDRSSKPDCFRSCTKAQPITAAIATKITAHAAASASRTWKATGPKVMSAESGVRKARPCEITLPMGNAPHGWLGLVLTENATSCRVSTSTAPANLRLLAVGDALRSSDAM